MPGQAAKVILSERHQEILQEIVHAKTSAKHLTQRAEIILRAFDKKLNREISVEIGLNPNQVGIWRRRWRDHFDHLVLVECTQTRAELKREIEKVLSDLPRAGRSSCFTTEQQSAIVAIACEHPADDSDRPISHWTSWEIADEAIERGIVESISASCVRSFLKSAPPQASSFRVLVVPPH